MTSQLQIPDDQLLRLLLALRFAKQPMLPCLQELGWSVRVSAALQPVPSEQDLLERSSVVLQAWSPPPTEQAQPKKQPSTLPASMTVSNVQLTELKIRRVLSPEP